MFETFKSKRKDSGSGVFECNGRADPSSKISRCLENFSWQKIDLCVVSEITGDKLLIDNTILISMIF